MGKKKGDKSRRSESSLNANPFAEFQKRLRDWSSVRRNCMPLVQKAIDLCNESTYLTTEKVTKALGSNVLNAPSVYFEVQNQIRDCLSTLEDEQCRMQEYVDFMSDLCAKYTSGKEGGEEDNDSSFISEQDSVDAQETEGDDKEVDADDISLSLSELTLSSSKKGNNAPSSALWPLDTAFTQELLESLKQQTLLETNICERLKDIALSATSPALASMGETGPIAGIDVDEGMTILACTNYSPHLNESALDIVLKM